MRKSYLISAGLVVVSIFFIAFKANRPTEYAAVYNSDLAVFTARQQDLLREIDVADLNRPADVAKIRSNIAAARLPMKCADFWLRYLDPTLYKKINGPLPVEWETEAFEKFEKPYKRTGAGLALATQYICKENLNKDSLRQLINQSLLATEAYVADSIAGRLNTYDHFYLCNRLFLLNLAAIYTTGFECPDTAAVIPELRTMLDAVGQIYRSFNNSFPQTALPPAYLSLADEMHRFVTLQPDNYRNFDHFTFIRDYVNPLFMMNQDLVKKYSVVSRSMVDFSLSKQARSIFDKKLYNAQNPKGIYIRVDDTDLLAEIEQTGKLLFYDPILSGNNLRSCASCHKPAGVLYRHILPRSAKLQQAGYSGPQFPLTGQLCL